MLDRAISEYSQYCREVSQEEQLFRGLFGNEELEDVRKRGYAQAKPYLDFLREETERKLREQDGD